MKILVHPSALKPINPDFYLRAGSLSGMRRLLQNGWDLLGDIVLSEDQVRLMRQESIIIQPIAGKQSDFIVRGHGTGLVLFDSSNKELASQLSWDQLVDRLLYPERTAHIHRKTGETDIQVDINLDGEGKSEISTGIGFFDHMLDQIARHGQIDLSIQCQGDLEIDEHHTIEDTALALGTAIHRAVGDKKGIERYGFVLPMDESRALVALDLSGRPYLVFKGTFHREFVGDFPTEMVHHFFYSLAMKIEATLHVEFSGENDHHQVEACFKGFARALRQCIRRDEHNLNRIPSSKGVL